MEIHDKILKLIDISLKRALENKDNLLNENIPDFTVDDLKLVSYTKDIETEIYIFEVVKTKVLITFKHIISTNNLFVSIYTAKQFDRFLPTDDGGLHEWSTTPKKEDINEVRSTKRLRQAIDYILQRVKSLGKSRETSLSITKLQEANMWLGMNLKRLGEQDPYPESRNPNNDIIHPTADDLKY